MFLCWLIEALSYRHTTVPDAIAYLDLADACLKGNYGAIINGYWSPAYPALLGFALFISRAALPELVIAHFLNCLVLVAALVCFEYFMNGLLDYLARLAPADQQESGPLSAGELRAIGYALFFWASLYATPPSLDTPDGLVFVLVLFAAGILVRIANGENGWQWFVALGIALGLGYLSKAVMFPLSFVFLGVAWFAAGNIRRAEPRLIVALVSFLLVAGPFAAVLSKNKGRFTFGEAGRINYAEFVNGVPLFIHWQGGPPGAGTPIHPTRRILDTPPVYEFSSPLRGTYPPGMDQSYWYEGVTPHFELKGQLAALRQTLDDYFSFSIRLGSVLAVFFVLLFSSGRLVDYARNFSKMYFLWVPSVAAAGLYALVHVELRFIGAFILLVWAAAFSVLRIPRSSSGRVIARSGTLAILFLVGFQIAWSMGHSVVRLLLVRDFHAYEVAKELRRVGIGTGDRIACIGDTPGNHYWAHLAGVTIVAEVPVDGVSSFIASSPERKARTLSALAQNGVKIIVARDLPPTLAEDGWETIANTNYSIFVLHK